jgi:hypothetical protein
LNFIKRAPWFFQGALFLLDCLSFTVDKLFHCFRIDFGFPPHIIFNFVQSIEPEIISIKMKRLIFFLFAVVAISAANVTGQSLPGNSHEKISLKDFFPSVSGKVQNQSLLKGAATSIVGSYPQQVDWYSWTGSSWMADMVEKVTYNQLGDYVTVTWDFISGNDLKTTYTYNNLRYPTQILEQEFIGGAWVNVSRERIEFDANNNATLFLSEIYQANDWVIESAMQMDNEVQNGKLIKTTYKIWNSETKVYEVYNRTTYSYSGNQISSYINEVYEESVWKNSTRVTIAYKSDGDEDYMIYDMWEADEWVPYSKNSYEYGQNGSLITIMSIWDEDANDFVQMMRDNSQNDSHGNLVLQTNEMWMMTDWFLISGSQFDITYSGNNPTQQITKEWSGMEYENSTKEVFSGFLNLSVEDPTGLNVVLHVFPNPAEETLTIQYPLTGSGTPSIQLVDVAGRPVRSETTKRSSAEVTWDISELPSGVYFVRMVQDNGNVLIQKVLKQ